MLEENTKFIIDSSFILAHLLPDEKVNKVDSIFDKYAQGEISFYAPFILPFEVVNGLRYAVTSKRIVIKTAQTLIDDFLMIKIEFQEVNFKKTLKMSFKRNCSIYDASYIALSQQINLPFLTLDSKLQKLAE